MQKRNGEREFEIGLALGLGRAQRVAHEAAHGACLKVVEVELQVVPGAALDFQQRIVPAVELGDDGGRGPHVGPECAGAVGLDTHRKPFKAHAAVDVRQKRPHGVRMVGRGVFVVVRHVVEGAVFDARLDQKEVARRIVFRLLCSRGRINPRELLQGPADHEAPVPGGAVNEPVLQPVAHALFDH